jgi:aminobenzoyl-glutamate utilization protein A
MNAHILNISARLYPEAVEHRRDLHRYPELGWTEFRTASRAADMLAEAGWEIQAGEAVCQSSYRMGLPTDRELAAAWDHATQNGGVRPWMESMQGGNTAVVALLRGTRPGPTVGLRFDMDALPIDEEADPGVHRPAREGFASIRRGIMHACGHDAHTAMGVAIGRALVEVRQQLRGTVKIILQPAEEGTRGAASMVAAGALDDVDYFLCPHVGAGSPGTGEIVPGVTRFLATEKFDVLFRGSPAHAGLAPEHGHNALLGSAQAVLGLHAISRHSAGNSRINVGILNAGSGRNIIPAEARLKAEVRGENNTVLNYLVEQAWQVVAGASGMWGLQFEIFRMGHAPSASSHPELIERVAHIAAELPGVDKVGQPSPATASDDATAMMQRVTERGGQAAYVLVGTPVGTGHHTPRFDIDEHCILIGIQVLTHTVLDILDGYS